MENLAVHALDARVMRQQYAKDAGLISDEHFVSTMDFAQNLALPHSSFTHHHGTSCLSSGSPFSEFTLIIRSASTISSTQNAGKGSNEVISMLHEFATTQGILSSDSVWTIYADNCGGQNKNGHLLRYLLLLVDSGRLKGANLYFLVKGNAKNHCDGGFGAVKRAYAKRDLYPLSMVAEAVEESSTTNNAVCLENRPEVFKDWKVLQSVYRDVKAIQKYQLFSMDSSNPGVVACRKRPSSEAVIQDLRKRGCVPSSNEGWANVWGSIQQLQVPIANPEKMADLHAKILPCIPEEFRSDPLYRAPTPEELEAAKSKKRRRAQVTPRLQDRPSKRPHVEEGGADNAK